MISVTLGRTGLKVNKNGFGALPIQRISKEEAAKLLRKAYAGGINLFDTARGYSDSEEKIGYALSEARNQIIITTKTTSTKVEGFWKDLETSLSFLKTDYIDVYQFHNYNYCPKPGDGTGMYEAMLEAKKQGKIRFIGITAHRIGVAREIAESNLYDTLQFPFSYLSSEDEKNLVNRCKTNNIGFIAMKALSGGLITNSAAAYAFMSQYENTVPIWGVQREKELDEFISYIESPPALTSDIKEIIENDRLQMTGEFCRGCGYCMPCPAEIEINTCARMSLLIRRMPSSGFLEEKGQLRMRKIEDCLQCGKCKEKCPYSLDTPKLLLKNYEDYKRILAGEVIV